MPDFFTNRPVSYKGDFLISHASESHTKITNNSGNNVYLCKQFQVRMLQRYFIRFSYDGTQYHGWQFQPNDLSVQETMTEIMRCVLGPELQLTAAGRTDAGVHAECMYAHFDTEVEIPDTNEMATKLNYMMPADIAVQAILPVHSTAHARFDAVSRTYEYRIMAVKDPFHRFFVSRYQYQLNVEAMNAAASALLDYRDFTSFSKSHTDVKTNNCRIEKASWEQQATQLVFTIKADRFLRNMVRAIVGTLLDVGRGKLDVTDFRRIIEQKDRCAAGISAHAKGLFLVDVEYPGSLFLQ
jgi:tRNA pseudouridine38-40 synthase